jgi:hypothetical protein
LKETWSQIVERYLAEGRTVSGANPPDKPPGGHTRLKMVCNTKTDAGFNGAVNLTFTPVYSGSEENKSFFAATPGGVFQFYTVNKIVADQFEMGREYYVDISPAV